MYNVNVYTRKFQYLCDIIIHRKQCIHVLCKRVTCAYV